MNIQGTLRRVYNKIKNLQIPDGEISNENLSRAIYLTGMLDSAKIFMNIYNGDLSEGDLEEELKRLEYEEIPNWNSQVETGRFIWAYQLKLSTKAKNIGLKRQQKQMDYISTTFLPKFYHSYPVIYENELKFRDGIMYASVLCYHEYEVILN